MLPSRSRVSMDSQTAARPFPAIIPHRSFPLIRMNVPLAPYTTLSVGGPARFMVEATDETQVQTALEHASDRGWPVFVMGGGSNVIVADEGFPGLVLRVLLTGMRFEGPHGAEVTAAAGEEWDLFVSRCIHRGLAGIECLSGIPGTVGGAPVQNAGAYGQEVGAVIRSVRAFDRQTNRIVELGHEECAFAYRSSLFNSSQRDRYVILNVNFRLRSGGAPQIDYSDLKEYFATQPTRPTLEDVRNAVVEVRSRKGMVLVPGAPDSKSAGSFFKNPILAVDEARFVEEIAHQRGILKASERLHYYLLGSNRVKLSAAWLIERAGFPKGYRRGSVGVSAKHSLAIVNHGGASAGDVIDLMEQIQDGVRGVFGIHLIPEPVFVGFPEAWPSNYGTVRLPALSAMGS